MKKMNEKKLSEEEQMLETLLRDKAVRIATVRGSFLWFFRFYFGHFVTAPTAPFQIEMMRLVEDLSNGTVAIAAFRGSGKSTIVTTAYTLWSMLGVHGRKHVLILSQTKEKALKCLGDIKVELETNERLRADLGPFREEPTPWGMQSLVIKHLDARISCGSVGQSIRGVRHRMHRPDLFVLDDIESLESVRTREGREKTWGWLTGEVLPAGDIGTRLVATGNILHPDAVMPRLGRAIESGAMRGQFRKYPLLDEKGVPLWPGKYPTTEVVERQRGGTVDETSWQREFMLRIVPTAEQVVWPEMIRKYAALPKDRLRFRAIGVDLARSLEESADCTAMIPVAVHGWGEDMRVYILQGIVNERLTFPDGIARAKALRQAIGAVGTTLVVEDNGYQGSFVQDLNSSRVDAVGITSRGEKRSRLVMTTSLMQQGRVLFPEHGAEELIEQLVGLGRELHDDLADAFSLVVNYAMGKNVAPVRTFKTPDAWKL